ncbi:MAG: SIR2 family protein [Lactobacillus delbrueckii]|jgi:hypothetical protein|nr:SIR2 family protein [Lactobacillus delbrueckii]MCH4220145.1 SIR2 family protein [Lactobacillus delbrueckii]MCH4253658.1 SIR2 family protein [Lactobacillus delbrueckii]
MGFLEKLKLNNEFPIIFIGSGITKRYFKNTPTWDELLQKLWKEAELKETYYSRYDEISQDYDSDFEIYTRIADELERKFDKSFYEGKIKIGKLTPEISHDEKKSPFRYRIAEIYSGLELRDNINDELTLFRQMLQKAKIIVTTNYDGFIEKQFDNKIKVKVGNNGLFEKSSNINELYKIHGSSSSPNSIVITSSDYQKLDRTSAIVNAKILSQLTESPILFLGYSLTDENIRSLLKDLSDNMPFSIEDAAGRIGVVNYEKGLNNINEVMHEDFGVHYTKISTDNYIDIYKKVAKIDQGISPNEIAKYQNAFRQIIDTKGKEGQLKHVFTSFVDLNKLPETLKNKNLVVAFGDNRYLYKYPDYVDYIKSYFLEKDGMPIEIAIKFIMKQPTTSTLPVSRYLSQLGKGVTLSNQEKDKINKRLGDFGSIGDLKIGCVSNKYNNILKKMDFNNPQELFNNKFNNKIIKLKYFAAHIGDFSKETAFNLIKYILENEEDSLINDTVCRKLFMAYSLKYEKIFNKL